MRRKINQLNWANCVDRKIKSYLSFGSGYILRSTALIKRWHNLADRQRLLMILTTHSGSILLSLWRRVISAISIDKRLWQNSSDISTDLSTGFSSIRSQREWHLMRTNLERWWKTGLVANFREDLLSSSNTRFPYPQLPVLLTEVHGLITCLTESHVHSLAVFVSDKLHL